MPCVCETGKFCNSCWYKKNKKKYQENHKNYYEKNKHKILKRLREYRQRPEIKKSKKKYQKEYIQIPVVKERHRKYRKNWEKENREHVTNYRRELRKSKSLEYKARDKVAKEVKKRTIPRAKDLNCVCCKNQAQEYHHHKGYQPENWLDIIPICMTCHNNKKIEVIINA